MTDTACTNFADLFVGKRENGLLDVKFYLIGADEASFEQVCGEVTNLYSAMERAGACETLVFKDSRRVA